MAVGVLEGHRDGRRLEMFELPSVEALHAFWNSPKFVPMKPMKKHRQRATDLDVWAVQGV